MMTEIDRLSDRVTQHFVFVTFAGFFLMVYVFEYRAVNRVDFVRHVDYHMMMTEDIELMKIFLLTLLYRLNIYQILTGHRRQQDNCLILIWLQE